MNKITLPHLLRPDRIEANRTPKRDLRQEHASAVSPIERNAPTIQNSLQLITPAVGSALIDLSVQRSASEFEPTERSLAATQYPLNDFEPHGRPPHNANITAE
jgi:hypothetical protein